MCRNLFDYINFLDDEKVLVKFFEKKVKQERKLKCHISFEFEDSFFKVSHIILTRVNLFHYHKLAHILDSVAKVLNIILKSNVGILVFQSVTVFWKCPLNVTDSLKCHILLGGKDIGLHQSVTYERRVSDNRNLICHTMEWDMYKCIFLFFNFFSEKNVENKEKHFWKVFLKLSLQIDLQIRRPFDIFLKGYDEILVNLLFLDGS